MKSLPPDKESWVQVHVTFTSNQVSFVRILFFKACLIFFFNMTVEGTCNGGNA